MNDSITKLLLLWLKNANYTIDESHFRLQFLSHPDAPSVSAVTDVLNDVSIANMAIEIPFSELTKLEYPFLTYIKQDREEQFALVQKKENGTWLVKLQVDGQIIISSQKFKELFTGLVVLIDPMPVKKIRNINNVLKAQYLIPAIIALIFIASFITNAPAVLHFLLGAAGLLASMLIAAKELGFNTGRFEKFCTLSTVTDCESVLKSQYSSVFRNVKLSDLSLVFFAFQTFAWLFCYPVDNGVAYYQYVISIAAVPVTAVSLYLQKFVLRKWCPLCLAVCGVLWAQAITAGLVFFYGGVMEFNAGITLTLAVALVTLWAGWQFIKRLLQNAGKNEELQINLMSFRRNYHLFLPLHRQLPEVETSIAGIDDIVLGSPNAPLSMVIVSNPLCATCIALHNKLHGWVKQYPELRISIRFYVPVENITDKRTLVAAKLVELYRNDAKAGIAEIDAWYNNPDFEAFYQKHSRKHNTEALQVLKQHRKWCLEKNIFITPSIIINRKRFPVFYEPEDIGFFLEELIRMLKTKVSHSPHSPGALNAVLS